jgi:hypothetical protein
LSADIDQLLSQMNDIDFGIGGDDDEEEAAAATKPADVEGSSAPTHEHAVVSPQLIEPSNPLDDEESSTETSPALQQHRQQDSGMLGVTGNSHQGILSADLTSLGSMMTGLS